MYQLIYQSACRSGTTIDTLREIAAQSAERNRLNAISGVMLVQGEDILQVLEGEEAVVRAVYHAISRDTRHGGCTVLLTRHCEERVFKTWHMGICEVDDDEKNLFRLAVASIKARRARRDTVERRSA